MLILNSALNPDLIKCFLRKFTIPWYLREIVILSVFLPILAYLEEIGPDFTMKIYKTCKSIWHILTLPDWPPSSIKTNFLRLHPLKSYTICRLITKANWWRRKIHVNYLKKLNLGIFSNEIKYLIWNLIEVSDWLQKPVAKSKQKIWKWKWPKLFWHLVPVAIIHQRNRTSAWKKMMNYCIWIRRWHWLKLCFCLWILLWGLN